MLNVFTTPSGVPTSHVRAVLAASTPAVEAQRGTGRMGHLVRPWQDSNLHGAGAHTGGRPRVTRTRGVHDAATLRALVPVIEQPGECVTGESVDVFVGARPGMCRIVEHMSSCGLMDKAPPT